MPLFGANPRVLHKLINEVTYQSLLPLQSLNTSYTVVTLCPDVFKCFCLNCPSPLHFLVNNKLFHIEGLTRPTLNIPLLWSLPQMHHVPHLCAFKLVSALDSENLCGYKLWALQGKGSHHNHICTETQCVWPESWQKSPGTGRVTGTEGAQSWHSGRSQRHRPQWPVRDPPSEVGPLFHALWGND